MSDRTTETQLFVDNDEPLYRQKIAIEKSLARWVCRGKFDPTKAQKAFRYLTSEAARRYRRDFSQPLEVADRREAEKDFAEDFSSRLKGLRAGQPWAKNDFASEVLAVLQKCIK